MSEQDNIIINRLMKKIKLLQAENERLREGLKKVVSDITDNLGTCPHDWNGWMHPDDCAEVCDSQWTECWMLYYTKKECELCIG